jgi:hypothetical protein
MRKLKSVMSVLVFFLLFDTSSILLALDSGSIEGTVKDAQTGKPLPGANVFIVGTSMGAATNLNGEYIIPKVPAGEYTIRATYIGYEQLEFSIKVLANSRSRFQTHIRGDKARGGCSNRPGRGADECHQSTAFFSGDCEYRIFGSYPGTS